ncbi:MAG: hypothetical protein U9R42_02875 [Bacteroidota bacterium]|nr:hypothetical protein [Bacteroidota bacterium]
MFFLEAPLKEKISQTSGLPLGNVAIPDFQNLHSLIKKNHFITQ